MAMMAMAVPVLPGKLDEWRQFSAELMGPRRAEYEASRRRMGVRSEHSFLQHTPMGDLVILVFEGDNLPAAMATMANSTDPFDQWTAAKAKEIHGLDPSQVRSTPLPEPGPSIG